MPSDTVVAAHGVTRRFGATAACDALDLRVDRGEIVAVVGPSGCGKSTLLRLISGLLEPDAGEIRIADRLVSGAGTWVPAEQRRVGIVFQDHALFPHLDVAGNVAFGLDSVSRRQRRARVGDTLDLVGLADYADRYPHELSGGEAQRIALARALAPRPQVILLDEPFSDLDRNLRIRVRTQTLEVLREAGATAVLVTHDREEALAVGDRVAVMRAGCLEQIETPEIVFHSPANRFVARFLGEADFLPGRRVNGTITTEAGPAPAPEGVADGASVEIMVRPHEVVIEPDPDGVAQVVGIEFQGAFVLYEVELPSGRRVGSLMPHTVALGPGERVRVELSHGHAPAAFQGEVAVAGPASPRHGMTSPAGRSPQPSPDG